LSSLVSGSAWPRNASARSSGGH